MYTACNLKCLHNYQVIGNVQVQELESNTLETTLLKWIHPTQKI